MFKMRWKFAKVFITASAVALAVATASTPAMAQQCAADEGGASKTLNTRVAQALGAIYEQMQAEQYTEALAALNQLIAQRGDSMKGFDKATTYELRGSVKASMEDYRGAQRDFQVALDTNELSISRNNNLRYFISQISFQLEDFQGAIRGLNAWIRDAKACGDKVDSNAYYLLAAAYVQLTPPNYRAAVQPAEQAIAVATEPKKGYYDLANLVYSETNASAKRMALLEKMVNYWPGQKGYWTQLSGAYSTAKKDRDAFSVLEVAYRAGLLSKESELKTLVQYYSFFDNPYRGAKMLEREMAAGNIKRTKDNLVLLSQLWSQAREHKKSIPILREAARGAKKGDLSYRLGQVLLADEQYARAQTALEGALNKGGMSRKNTGDAWLLLGTARFSQAGPESTEVWASARKAFVNAQRYETARKRATDWITYIDAVADTYKRGKKLEERQIRERCELDQGRLERDQRIRDLQNRPETAEDRAFETEFLERCTGPLGLGDDADSGDAAGGGGDDVEVAPEEGASDGAN
ncbi:hypothetical protein MNBD_ALPHA05-321 [hydrothermal vent metagenome]|uniref:TPR domain protein, component of TonB system n=1 Tax=hydrothermal vent metagenome TaxID=652676 RepID=A0A3B0SQZ9_9ZZZZ